MYICRERDAHKHRYVSPPLSTQTTSVAILAQAFSRCIYVLVAWMVTGTVATQSPIASIVSANLCRRSKRPSHSSRRKRQKQSLLAAVQKCQSLESAMLALGSPTSEVSQRLAKIAPCIEAQLRAAEHGKLTHTSRTLVDQDCHIIGGAAKHNFRHPIAHINAPMAKREQRGDKGLCTQPLFIKADPPPPPPPCDPFDGRSNLLTCDPILLDPAVMSAFKARDYQVIAPICRSTKPAALPEPLKIECVVIEVPHYIESSIGVAFLLPLECQLPDVSCNTIFAGGLTLASRTNMHVCMMSGLVTNL